MDISVFRKTVAKIDLDAIRENYAIAAAIAPQSKTMPVIKANAYGHGMVRVAEALQDVAPAFAVATLDEAVELRYAGISRPLLVLEGVNSADGLAQAVEMSLSLVVHCEQQLLQVAELPKSTPLWVKVDSGMHRLGFAPDQLQRVLDRLGKDREDIVICTHLACADDVSSGATQTQLDRFAACTAHLDLPTSISNSAGILAWPQSHADWNRPGYMLYGASPMLTDVESASGLRAAMTFQAEIIAIAEVPAGESVGYGARWTASQATRVGTVAVGYGDGYPRHAPNGTPTRVNGEIAPLIGTVSMDMLTIDLSAHESAVVGDAVELWGPGVSVNDVAERCRTIGYELMTAVSARVPRLYQQ